MTTEATGQATLKPKARRVKVWGDLRARSRVLDSLFVGGRLIRESAHSIKRSDAEALLKARLQEIGRGIVNPTTENRVTMVDLFDALEADYKINGRRSADTLPSVLRRCATHSVISRPLR